MKRPVLITGMSPCKSTLRLPAQFAGPVRNALKFRSATYDGLTVGDAYAFSNAAGGFRNNSAYSPGAQWAGGPFNLTVAYLRVNRPGGVN